MADSKELAPWEPFTLMEQAEDQDLVEEIKGRVIHNYIYAFPKSKEKQGSTDINDYVVGLSKAGVDALCRELANKGEVVRELDLQLMETDKAFRAIVKAGRYAVSKDGREQLLDTTFAGKSQPKFWTIRKWNKEKRDFEEVEEENPFAFEIAIAKASRNARRRLIPETLAVEIIKKAWEEGRVKTVLPEQTKIEEEDERTKLVQRIHIEANNVDKDYYEEVIKPRIKTQFNKDSSKDLSIEELRTVLNWLTAPASEEDKRAFVLKMKNLGFQTKQEMTDQIIKSTGKERGWTLADLDKTIRSVSKKPKSRVEEFLALE